MSESETKKSLNFIEEIIEDDLRTGKWDGRVVTRFPPEPNGYLHIGHAKSICLNFGLANKYGGVCNLRFDDTNPAKEEDEYVRSITEDIGWLGFGDDRDVLFASDYFEQLYAWAVQLIKTGHAYVCDLSPEETRKHRGTLTTPGVNSPFRDRPAGENLDLFERMRRGEFADGSRTLRAKIDMASPNTNLRDPVMYRILHAEHHRTGDAWSVYPMYDWAHGLEDSIEGVTHSICTLEFENHRPLYDWFIEAINSGRGSDGSFGEKIHHPQQIEFARLGLNYTLMSKRKLLELVRDGHVTGWDDPRMPTLSGMRRRGYTPESIRTFCERVGVAKTNSTIDMAKQEHCVREDLNARASRVMCVLRPLKVVIENWSDGGDENRVEMMEAINNPEDASAGVREVPFGKELYIERSDFMEEPPRKFFRLGPDREVRLRYGYWIRCVGFEKNEAGAVTLLRCTYDPATRGGDSPPDGRKVKGTLHWVAADSAVEAEVRLFDRLFVAENPDKAADGGDYHDNLNPESLERLSGCKLEANWMDSGGPAWSDGIRRVQFERQGYFCLDRRDAAADRPVFNRTVGLRDSWAKLAARGGK